ncbi:MAG: hypothetical protein CMM01_19605 [Rhodopirellula sp.]|nr:hypothetical protein [Rhodopirellula sp.]
MGSRQPKHTIPNTARPASAPDAPVEPDSPVAPVAPDARKPLKRRTKREKPAMYQNRRELITNAGSTEVTLNPVIPKCCAPPCCTSYCILRHCISHEPELRTDDGWLLNGAILDDAQWREATQQARGVPRNETKSASAAYQAQ